MPKPITFTAGPFSKGMNTAVAPHLLGPDEASDCLNVDVSLGTLRATCGGVTCQTDAPGTCQALHYMASGAWATSDAQIWFCDTADPNTPGAKLTCYTQPYPSYQAKAMTADGKTYKLGLPAPSGSFAVSGGTGGACQYAVTFYDPATGIESNPLYATGTASGPTGASLTGIPTYATTDDPNRTGVHRRIYRTQAGSSSGYYYFLTEITNNTATTFTDGASYILNTQAPLDWTIGGNFDNAIYPFDHDPAPQLTCLANEFYLPGGVQGSGGAGLLFGAVNNYLFWTAKDSPHYWPNVNSFRVNAPGINAIVVHGPQAFLFCENDIFVVSGNDETSLTISRCNVPFGVKFEHAKTVCRTPYGILFLSRQGLALFDGSSVNIISRGVMSPYAFRSSDLFGWASGGFIEGFYYLSFGDAVAFRFDLRNMPDITVTQVEGFQACEASPMSGSSLALFTINSAGVVKQWRPSDDRIGGGDIQPWYFVTGQLRSGPALHPMRLNRFTLDATGTVQVDLYKDDETTPFRTLTRSDRLAAETLSRLTVKLSSADGTGVVKGFRIDGEVYDGT